MLVDLVRQQTRAAQDSLREATAAARIPKDLTVRGFHRVLRGMYIWAGIGFHGLMTAREGVLHGNPSQIALGAGMAVLEGGLAWASQWPRIQDALSRHCRSCGYHDGSTLQDLQRLGESVDQGQGSCSGGNGASREG